MMVDRSPTPRKTYEPRWWKVRIWTKGGPFEGTPIQFNAPYGVYMNAIQILGRAIARGQIQRFTFGPLTARDFKSLDRANRQRYEQAFAQVGQALGIDWAA